MKKALLFLLTMVYMTVSSGIAMEIHYCMGERTGMDLFDAGNGKCGRCGMKEKKGGCCNDEHKFYKLADAHKNVSNDHNYTIPFFAPAIAIMHEPGIVLTKLSLISVPAADTGPPLYITYRVFRI